MRSSAAMGRSLVTSNLARCAGNLRTHCGHLLLAMLMLAGGLWSHATFAQSLPVCDLQAVNPTFQSGPAGTTINFSFDVTDPGATGCDTVGTSGTITLIPPDSTGGATLSTPFYSGNTGNYPFSVSLGPTPGGSVQIQINCLKNCDPSGTSQLNYFAFTDNVETFAPYSPPGGVATIGIGQPITLTVLYTFNNNPVSGNPVDWSVAPTTGTTLTPTVSTTDAAGHASSTFTALHRGTYTVTAQAECAGAPVRGGKRAAATGKAAATTCSPSTTFTITVVPLDLTIVSGNNQSGPINTPAAQPLVVHAANGSTAAVGVGINWTVQSGSATITSTSGATDSLGNAQASVSYGPTAGPIVIRATRADSTNAFVDFNLTSQQSTPTATLTIVSGNNQNLIPNTPSAPLVVALTDSNSNPIAGGVINWSGNNATLTSNTSTTDASGRASNIAVITALGPATVTASFAGTGGTGGTAVSRFASAPASAMVTFNFNSGLGGIPGLTPQEAAVANALDNACPALAALSNRTPAQQDLYLRCLDLAQAAGSNPDEVKNALDQLFADIAFVESNAAQLISDAQFTNIKARIAALRSGTNGSSFGGLALNGPNGSFPIGLALNSALGLADDKKDDKKEIGADFDRWGFFAAGTFGRGNADPRSVVPGYKFDTNGLTAGVDYRYSDSWIFGVTAGYAKYSSTLDAGGGHLDTKGWSLSAYSTLYRKNSWYVDGVLTFGHNSFDISRHIFYSLTTNAGTTTIDQQANSSSSGNSIEGAFTVGRDFQKGPWSFGPFLRGTYTHLSFGTANETLISGTPGNGLGLVINSRDVTSDAVVLGGKLTYASSHSWGVLIPHMQFEWEHDFQNDPNHLEAHFLADPTGTPIIVHGNTIDTDFGRLGFGLSFIFTGGKSGFVYYEKTLGRDGITQDNLALGIRLEF
jgi:uncharacterized protein with beta-barrel porin domain